MVLFKKGEVGDAETLCRKALDGLQKALGSENPDVTACDRDYSAIIEEMTKRGLGLGGLNIDREEEGTVVMDLYDAEEKEDEDE